MPTMYSKILSLINYSKNESKSKKRCSKTDLQLHSIYNKKLFADYPDLLTLQVLNGLQVQKGYRTDREAAIFTENIVE